MRVILGRGSRRIHLLTGVYFAGMVLATITIAVTDMPSSLESDTAIRLATLGLIAGIVFAVAVRLERAWVTIVTVPFAYLATLASGFYPIENPGPALECAVFRVNKGFPLPWNSTYHTTGAAWCPAPLLPLLDPTMGGVSFSLDMVFYAAIGLAIIQLYRGVTGKTIKTRSSRVNKMV